MKKLALALVCFASVAFFASCQQEITNPEPTISVITDEGFVDNDDVVNLEQPIVYGFQMASNSQTKKELKQLSIASYFIDLDGNEELQEEEIIPLTGKTEYRFVDTVMYEITTRDLVGSVKNVATVTDVDGKVKTATLEFDLNQPAQPLISRAINWVRSGQTVENATETDMANMGLQWTGSYRDIMATIRPLDNATLYLCPGEDFDEITTDVEKAEYFASLPEYTHATAIDKYRNISAEQSHTYNDMLAVVYNGGCYLIHITYAKVDNLGSAGTKITITGDTK